MRLTGEGLFVVGVGEPLTAALFTRLVSRGEPFAVKADYRGVTPPIEELDLVHLRPDRGGCPRGAALVLRALDDGGFEFVWTHARDDRSPTARVVAVERTGRLVRLDAWHWRGLGRVLAASPPLARGFARGAALAARLWRPIPPAAVPLMVPSAERLVAEVRAKWADPAEVRRLAAESDAPALEPWEQDIFERLVPARARVLVIGCGGGRESLALAARGFTATGIDFVPALVDEARRRAAAAGVTATFETETAETLATRVAAAFDVVLSTTPVYEQIPGRARRVEFLRALTRLAAPGGLVVLCAAWHRERGPRRALIDGARWLLRRAGVRAAAEPGDRFTYHHSIVSHHATRTFFHVFQRPEEIARELAAARLVAERHPDGPWLVRIPPR